MLMPGSRKIAVLSHSLPPSKSGQAAVLSKLLPYIADSGVCLIAPHNDAETSGERVHTLVSRPLFVRRLKLPAINPNKSTALHRVFRPLLHLYMRLRNGEWATADPDTKVTRRARRLREILERENCGVLVACTGDVYSIPAGLLATRGTDIAFVPYIFDYYAYQWSGNLQTQAKAFEAEAIKGADAVIVTNEEMGREYRQLYGVAGEVLHNPTVLPDLESLDAVASPFDNRYTNIVYTGSVYSAHYDAFRNLIAAIDSLFEHQIKLHLFTKQPQFVLAMEGIGGEHIEFHDPVPYEQVAALQRHADILFLPLAFNSPIPEVIRTASPGKMGEYLAVGRPVLVHAPAGSFMSTYFRDNQCGSVVDEDDPALLAQALHELIANPDRAKTLACNAVARAAEEFDIEAVGPMFAALMDDLLKDSRA